MNNSELAEVRNRLYALPSLEERLKRLTRSIYEAENQMKALLSRYNDEALDVEKLENESFSATLLRLFGRYEGKLDKEKQEMIEAKLNYDKVAQQVKELYKERDELSERISRLRADERQYKDEIKRREDEIRSNVSGEKSMLFAQLESEEKELHQQMVETDEAIMAAKRALSTANTIIKHLDSAESWATYDVWFKSGIISHMAKYGHIDEAEEAFHKLSSDMKSLQRELKDVNFGSIPEIAGISSTTRAVDFWFDNIFTDLNVRNQIRDDLDRANLLARKIENVITKLESNKNSLCSHLSSIEQQKNELIIS